MVEKIDIERVCWELLGVKFRYFTGNELTRVQSSNLEWASSPFRENSICFSFEPLDCALSIINVGQFFIEDVCNHFISMNVISYDDALLLVRFLIADHLIEVELSTNIPGTGLIDVLYVAEHQGGTLYGAS
ncbi:hypothetical protein ACT0HV_000583 [Vibrio diabolicus]